MATLRQGQSNTVAVRPSKPSLTIDTQAAPKSGVDLSSVQSAPVGTRQEKGIPPMYQYADRYCAKVAEMMNTPTWRSQRPGPAVVDDSGTHSSIGDRDYVQLPDHHKENNLGGENSSGNAERRPEKLHHDVNKIQMGRDGEAMSILGIHPFLETPETPESSADTFIISATLCDEARSPVNAVFGEMHPFRIPRKRSGIQSKTAEDEDYSEHSREDDYMHSYKESAQSSPRSVSDSPGHVRARNQKKDEDHMAREEAVKEKVRDIHELMERDEAIESVNYEHVSPRRRGPATPEEERRFRGILGRLQPRNSGERMEKPTLVDPAIICFGHKRQEEGNGYGNFMAQLRAAEKKYLEENRQNTRSDSGYASPTTYSRPSTRARSRSRQDSSDDAAADTLSGQHHKFASKDSGIDSPSKHSILNPAAKEFSFANSAGDSPTRKGERVHLPVFDNFYSPPQESQNINISFAPTRPAAAFQSPGLGFNGLSSHITGPMNLFTTPGLPQASQRILSQTSNLPNTNMPPPPGFGHTGTFAPLGGATGPLPNLAHPLGLGLPGLSPPAGLVSTPRLVHSGLAGPFHHQLPATASCNNPAHQSISPFNSSHVSPVPPITTLPPPAPPAPLLPRVTNARLPPPAAPTAPGVAPYIRKNVPKPKVPNTTGQQYWEYVHELRRMYEPGYAQKSKANQQKRFMKQLHKKGDTAGQS
ncbi:hypothetical protein VMCG_06451 [Cytospora schulzeri]|uniref:Uncharacterized protein n=1 Tax=Cytospora schulzeri TaxID=448051 RepID=A0A423WBS2_9PEZI|nr:hypothetical protein VMCG_06451 [Valsa malicola]